MQIKRIENHLKKILMGGIFLLLWLARIPDFVCYLVHYLCPMLIISIEVVLLSISLHKLSLVQYHENDIKMKRASSESPT